MIEILKELIPEFSHVQESEIINKKGIPLGFQSTIITKENFPYAGGTAYDLNLSRRICFSEAIERAHFYNAMNSSSTRQSLLLDEYPTSCGFAAGFEEEKTIFRAICEAVERWAWSRWIDKKNKIPKSLPNIKTKLSQYYLDSFDEVIFLQTPITINSYILPTYIPKKLVWSVALGINANGIFPGSRVTTSQDEMWEHCLLEAWRHKKIYENELNSPECKDIIDMRIKYFGNNKQRALEQCIPFISQPFPEAKLRLVRKVSSISNHSKESYFVYRALCEDFIGWEKGNESRFVY